MRIAGSAYCEFAQLLPRFSVSIARFFVACRARPYACRVIQRSNQQRCDETSCASWLSIPKFLVLWGQDTFGVTSERESRNCHDSVDEFTGVPYQNRQVEWRLPLVNERHGSCAIRVQSVGSRFQDARPTECYRFLPPRLPGSGCRCRRKYNTSHKWPRRDVLVPEGRPGCSTTRTRLLSCDHSWIISAITQLCGIRSRSHLSRARCEFLCPV